MSPFHCPSPRGKRSPIHKHQHLGMLSLVQKRNSRRTSAAASHGFPDEPGETDDPRDAAAPSTRANRPQGIRSCDRHRAPNYGPPSFLKKQTFLKIQKRNAFGQIPPNHCNCKLAFCPSSRARFGFPNWGTILTQSAFYKMCARKLCTAQPRATARKLRTTVYSCTHG